MDGNDDVIPTDWILVVDDEDAIRALIAEILTDEGYAVVTARNGADALRLIGTEAPRLVLLDLQMPVLDGQGFVHALATRGICLPVIVMSAHPDLRAQATILKAIGCMAKPFELLRLLAMVKRHAPGIPLIG